MISVAFFLDFFFFFNLAFSGRVTCVPYICVAIETNRRFARCCACIVPSLHFDDSDTFVDHEDNMNTSMHGSVTAGDDGEEGYRHSSHVSTNVDEERGGNNRPRTSSYGGGGGGYSSSSSSRCLRWLQGKGCGSGGTQPLRQKVGLAEKKE